MKVSVLTADERIVSLDVEPDELVPIQSCTFPLSSCCGSGMMLLS